eukprot:g586.t1
MVDLVLVRHGESEGNIARKRSLMGDHSLYTGEFLRRHSSLWRLTGKGREQARCAGSWVQANVGQSFDRYYTSEYLRSMETAGLLGLPDAQWFGEMFLRERDWGNMDLLSQEERHRRYRRDLELRDRDRFFWEPPGGESLASVCLRVDRFITMLHRECANQRVMVVCHGEVMWAFRARLERMTQMQYRDIENRRSMRDHLHPGQVLHYSRRDPISGELNPFFSHVRSACPWLEEEGDCPSEHLPPSGWKLIKRPVCSNNELLHQCDAVQPVIPDDVSAEVEFRRSNSMGEYTASDDVSRLKRTPSQRKRDQTEAKAFQMELGLGQGWLPENSEIENFDGETRRNYNGMKDEDSNGYVDDTHFLEKKLSNVKVDKEERLKRSLTETDPARLYGTNLKIKKALIVSKTPRYEYEFLRHLEKDGKISSSDFADTKKEINVDDPDSKRGRALREELARRGLRYSLLHESYEAHQRSLTVMQSDLEKAGVECRVVRTSDLTQEDVKDIDVAFAAGGDGTLLALAQQIDSPSLPVIGVNTDPDRSKGALCSIRMHSYVPQSCGTFAELLRKLEAGEFKWKLRNRLTVRILHPVQEEVDAESFQNSPNIENDDFQNENIQSFLALNEIFFAERDASKPASHEIQIDGGEPDTCRSSGVIVCTGSGSTAWMMNATTIHQDDVERVLEHAGHAPRSGLNLAQITQRVNSSPRFDPQSPYMEYLVREPVVNPYGMLGEELQSRRGFARRVELRALGWDTVVAVDAVETAATTLPYGSRVVLEIDSERALRTIDLEKKNYAFK